MLALANRTDGSRGIIWEKLCHPTEKHHWRLGLLRRKITSLLYATLDKDKVLSGVAVLEALFIANFDFENSMQYLFELSLISKNFKEDGISIHPLVQTWCQTRGEFHNQNENRAQALLIIARALDQTHVATFEWDRYCRHLELAAIWVHKLQDKSYLDFYGDLADVLPVPNVRSKVRRYGSRCHRSTECSQYDTCSESYGGTL